MLNIITVHDKSLGVASTEWKGKTDFLNKTIID